MIATIMMIFGLTAGELISLLGLIAVFLGGLIYIRTKLVEVEVKVLDIIARLNKNEDKIEETALALHNETNKIAVSLQVETDKMNERMDKKMDKIEEKIDKIVETTSNIRINCVAHQEFLQKQQK